MKTFRQLIVENSKEYAYKVVSTQNIHTPEKLELIKLAALSHDCAGVEADYHKVAEKSNKDFPELPNTEAYAVKVFTGLEVCPVVFREELLMRVGIKKEHFKVTAEGHSCERCAEPETDLSTTPGNSTDGAECPKADADPQSLVGDKRIGSFLKSLERAKDQMTPIEVKPIKESYFVPHTAIQKVTGQPTRKGFWLIESDASGMTCEGPFETVQEGVPYKDEIEN